MFAIFSMSETTAIGNKLHLFIFIFIFREEATSSLAGFHASPLSLSNRNLEMLVYVKGGKNIWICYFFC